MEIMLLFFGFPTGSMAIDTKNVSQIHKFPLDLGALQVCLCLISINTAVLDLKMQSMAVSYFRRLTVRLLPSVLPHTINRSTLSRAFYKRF